MKKRVIALALSIVMLATCLGAGMLAPTPVTLVDENGAEATSAVVPQLGRKTLTASYADATEKTGYQWQFSNDGDTWIDIFGETAQTCSLSYAKVKNMLDADGEAQLRCVVTDGEDERISSAATVTVDYSAQTAEAATEAQSGVSLKAAPARAASYSLSPATQNADTPSTYNVVINYLFENNAVAADPYTANLAAGSNFSTTVTFPTVQGYLPYVDNERQDSIVLNYTAIDKDYTINVVYKPTNVDYTVIHYQQNLNDDKYTEVERETKQGLTNSTVPDVANTYAGFYALLYEKPNIAADGSTVVEIYYDRYYYLMNFDLDGGYGVEPIYARYGTKIGTVGTPTKAGYTFSGWSLDGTNVVTLPKTMPAENRTYKAVWTSDATAKVTVVFWGENADDEEYSYIRSMQVDATPGKSYSYDGSTLTCPLAEHSHGTSKCTLNCTHVHTLDCYYTSYGFVETKKPTAGLTNNGNGIYTYTTGGWFSTPHYYLNIGDKWYCGIDYWGDEDDTESISFDCEHTHTDACYSCGLTEHTHSSACSGLWTFVKSDTVTVAADGSSVVNVYYDRTEFTLTFRANNRTVATITDKWGAAISGEFNKAPFNTTYNGRAWKCTETSKYNYALQTLDRMPQFNATFNLYDKSSNTLKTIYYYVENVGANVSENTWPSNTTNFTLLKTVQTYFNYATYNEEYHEIAGFTRYSANVAGFNDSEKDFSKNQLYLYYLRNDYTLTFNDGYNDVKTEKVQYQAPLNTYSSYVPDVPSAYEPGSVIFGGWYLNPECTGEEYKLNERTMPLGNLILYAKWVPVTHTVEFYLDNAALKAGNKLSTHPDITVPHGSKVDPIPETPENGSYTFIGWFYMENGVEKAFDFANMPVNKDMQVYGKWSSNVLKSYFIYYKIQGTDTKIAAPTTGSGLAGVTKTFEAKGGSDLYAEYQEGYFPVTKSHSMTLDINATEENDTNVYTFWYVQKAAVPYTVKYLNKETGVAVADEKTVSDNRKAVVTETFVPVSGMMPDAYQKRLVVSAEEGAVNEIIFYYTQDTTHAYYKITHYTENLAKDAQGNTTWTEYASSQAVGDIGTIYNADPMTIPGLTYDSTVDGTVASGELTANGLELKLYYTRNSYPYQVRYLEQGTGTQLAAPKNGTGKYGQVVSESAKDIANYAPVAPTSQTLNIRIEEGTEAKLNIITFYYTEKEVTINYQVVGPAGCGTVTPASETLKVLTGTASGSTAAANAPTFRFVGWYKDKECTQHVDSSWVDANNKLTPVKAENAAWIAATYYAKFEYNLTDLTITKNATPYDANDMFIFTVKDSAGKEVAKVALTAGQSVTIKNLTVGETYTVTEDNNWSWRYEDVGDQTIKLEATGNEVTVNNTLEKNNWLGASSYAINRCVKKIATDVFEIVKSIFGN